MKKVINIITTIALTILITFAGVLVGPKLFGIQPMAVLSGSMEPTYHVGSIIYVKENVSKEDIEIGDPITFHVNADTVVTHRVVEIDDNGDYVTKGDANENKDGNSVRFENVIGKPLLSIPYLGYIAIYATTKQGIIVLVTAVVATLLLTFLPDLLEDKKDGENNENK